MIAKTLHKIIDSDIGYSFLKSKIAIISTIVFLIILFCSIFAELVSPYDPFNPLIVSLVFNNWICISCSNNPLR